MKRRRPPKRKISIRRVKLLPEVANLMQVARTLSVDRQTVRNWIRGGLGATRESVWEIRRSDVLGYLRETNRITG
jgi:hypothetical protein